MPVDFLTFLSQINDAVIAEDGHDLGFLLQPTSRHSKDLVKEFLPATVSSWYCVRTVEHELNKWLYRKNPWRDLKVSSLALGTRLQYLMSWPARMLPWKSQEKRSRSIPNLYRVSYLCELWCYIFLTRILCLDHFHASLQRTEDGHCLHYFRSWKVWGTWLLMCVSRSCMTNLICSHADAQADMDAKFNNQKVEAMEEAARIIAKAFSNCVTDR